MANSKLQIGNRQSAIGNVINRQSAIGNIRNRTVYVSFFLTMLCLFSLFLFGCDGAKNQRARQQQPTRTQESPVASTPDKPKETTFEEDLNYVKLGQFRYVLVFSRLDRAVMNQDDFNYLKVNAPQEVNHWVKTDGGRRAIAGSNFAFTPEHLDALKKRFKIEDYSDKK
jgi:hypothetical protein